MLSVRFVTVTNRASETAVDPSTTTWPELHKLAADALDLDEASVKLVVVGTGARLTRTPADEPIGAAASSVFHHQQQQRQQHSAGVVITTISVIGVRNKVAQSTPRRTRRPDATTTTTTSASPSPARTVQQAGPATPPPTALDFAADATTGSPTTPARTAAAEDDDTVCAASPPLPPPSRVPVPPAEVLRGVIRDVEAAPNAHRRRRVITTNPVIDRMGENLRRFPSDESEAVLRELVERIHVVCPEFIDKVIREHSRDFLDAINGVVGAITMPFATDAAAGVPGGAFVASLAEALSGGGGAGGGDDDGDGATIEIRGDTVAANTLVDILSQAILAELANQTGIELTARGEEGRDWGDDFDDDDDDNDEADAAAADANEPRFVDLDRQERDTSNKRSRAKPPPHVARVAKAEKEVSRVRRELEMATSIANAGKHSAAAAQCHSAWCVLRRSAMALGRREGNNEAVDAASEDETAAALACVHRDIHGLQTKAINGAVRSLSVSIRQRLAALLMQGAGPAAAAEESPNSPNTGYSSSGVNGGVVSRGFPTDADDDDGESAAAAAAPGFGFTEGQHSNAVLAALDDFILLESIASAAIVTFVGTSSNDNGSGGGDAATSARSGLDTASALSTILWMQDLRRYNDAIFGLLELARPSGSATRPMHGGMDAAPFGTTPPTPKLYVDAARSFLDRHHGNRRAAAAIIEAELAERSSPQPPATEDGGSTSPRRQQNSQAAAVSSSEHAIDELGTFYDRDVAQLVRLSQSQNLCIVVYSSDLCFFAEGVAGTEMNPFLTLQEVYRARCQAKQPGTSVGFVVAPGGSMIAELLSGVSYTVQRGLPRLVATTSDMACDDQLAELSRVLLRPLTPHLPSRAAPSTTTTVAPPTVSFVTLFSVDDMSIGHAAEEHQQHQSAATSGGGGGSGSNAPSPSKKRNGSSSSQAGLPLVSPEDAIIVPFGAMPLPLLQPPSPPPQPSPSTAVLRVIDRYCVTVTPTVHSLLSSWSAPEAPAVRARIRGGPARGQRQPWLTAASARILNVRRQRERGAEEQTRWTVLADSGVPRPRSGISADLFISTSAPTRASYRRDGHASAMAPPPAANVAFTMPHASAASSAVVSAWAPPALHLGPASPGGAVESDASSDVSDDDGDHHHAASATGDLAHVLRTELHRHLLDQLCSAAEQPLTVAVAFRTALLAVRAKYPEAGVSQWAPLTVLHSGRALDGLRAHVRGLTEEAAERTSAMRSRLTVRGPLSAAESRNVRYVQQHDIPGLLDTLCRELLATRPDGEVAVLDTLIATLGSIEPSSENASAVVAIDADAAATARSRQGGI